MSAHGVSSCPVGCSNAPLSCLINSRKLKEDEVSETQTDLLVFTARYRDFSLTFIWFYLEKHIVFQCTSPP